MKIPSEDKHFIFIRTGQKPKTSQRQIEMKDKLKHVYLLVSGE